MKLKRVQIFPFDKQSSCNTHETTEKIIVNFDNLINLTSLSKTIKNSDFIEIHDINTNRFFLYVLQEIIPLLKVGSTLELFIKDNDLLTSFGLRSLISRWFRGLQFVEISSVSDKTLLIYKNTSDLERDPFTGWSFGVLCKKTSPDYLANFIDSCVEATKYSEDSNFEIILYMGDESKYDFGEASELVKTIGNRNSKDSNISRKKNEICESAQYSEILLCHDRFVLGSDITYQYKLSGYKFDLSVPKIHLSNGLRALDWGVINSSNDSWSDGALLNYRDNNRFAYIPGGLTVVRKQTWQSEPWNESLSWNEHEDVELSKRYQQRGLRMGLVPGNAFAIKDRWISDNPTMPFDDKVIHLPGMPRNDQLIKFIP
jgi:hypothetical protein